MFEIDTVHTIKESVMRLNTTRWNTVGVAIMALAAAQIGHARSFELDWSTLDGGGIMTNAGTGMEVSGTIGQCDAGQTLTVERFTLTGGFWFGIGPGDCNWDGTLNMLDCSALADCVTGPNHRPRPDCVCFDMDDDIDVDLDDFAAVQEMFNH